MKLAFIFLHIILHFYSFGTASIKTRYPLLNEFNSQNQISQNKFVGVIGFVLACAVDPISEDGGDASNAVPWR